MLSLVSIFAAVFIGLIYGYSFYWQSLRLIAWYPLFFVVRLVLVCSLIGTLVISHPTPMIIVAGFLGGWLASVVQFASHKQTLS
jgi:hypothetical protein